MSRVRGLDGIRGLAIGLVLLSHSLIYHRRGDIREIGLEAGYVGVSIFFVLSGYLITTLLLQEERRAGRIDLPAFYMRRALRLFPALWLFLFVVAAVWMAGVLPEHPWHSFVTSLLYVRNLVGHGHETAHIWSLSLEEQFYLLWPLLLIALRGRRQLRLVVAAALILVVTTWRVYAAHAGLAEDGALYIRSDFRFDAPLYGCVLALILDAAPQWSLRLSSGARRGAVLGTIATLGIGAWIGLRLDGAVFGGTAAIYVSLLATMLVVAQLSRPTLATRWLASQPMAAIGQVSYGVYLWQQFFLGPSAAGLDFFRSSTLLGLVLTFAAAGLSYRFVERPILRFKERHFSHRGTKESEALPEVRAARPSIGSVSSAASSA